MSFQGSRAQCLAPRPGKGRPLPDLGDYAADCSLVLSSEILQLHALSSLSWGHCSVPSPPAPPAGSHTRAPLQLPSHPPFSSPLPACHGDRRHLRGMRRLGNRGASAAPLGDPPLPLQPHSRALPVNGRGESRALPATGLGLDPGPSANASVTQGIGEHLLLVAPRGRR